MTTPLRRTDRRGALRSAAAAALVVPVLAACDATDTTAGRSGTLEPTTGAAAGDAGIVASLAGHMAGLRVAAAALAKHDRARRSWALGLAALHQQHLRKLGATGARPAIMHAATPQALAAAEKTLQQALVRAAGQTRSGALAQVLAAMAAGVEQRLVVA